MMDYFILLATGSSVIASSSWLRLRHKSEESEVVTATGSGAVSTVSRPVKFNGPYEQTSGLKQNEFDETKYRFSGPSEC